MNTKPLYLLIISVLLVVYSCTQRDSHSQTAKACLEEAEVALANDSILLGETLLRKTIHLAEVSEDWHTYYISYQRLAEALSQSNPKEALQLMKKALTIYEQHPDNERNHVILLDYTGTYAAQVAFIEKGSYDEALDYIHRAYDIAEKKQMADLMCQTLTSLANIAWAKEDYRQALNYAHHAKSVATIDLLPGTQQVLARIYFSLNMLDSAETVYRQIEPGDDVHLAYIVQSHLARIALRRMGKAPGRQSKAGNATQLEDSVAQAFEQVEGFYYKALEQKDEYYQQTLLQEMENQRLEYRSQMYSLTLLIVIIAAVIVLIVIVLALRYRIRMLRQEAAHQKLLLHQAEEVVAFLQNFILERTEVIKKLNQSGDSVIYLTSHEWNEIERTLNAIDNNRFAVIRKQHPDMTEDDIRLCILTRLGISNRTIGNIYCITVSAVQHRKLKLKKDVFGETNPDITLEQILTSQEEKSTKNR